MADDSELYSLKEIEESKQILNQHVEEEAKFWSEKYKNHSKEQIYKRIFVGGFSQGCALSLLYALTSDKLLGGVIGYSGHAFRSFDLKNKGMIYDKT